MEELQDMKTMWIELSQRISALEEDNRKLAQKVRNQKFKSTQEKLMRKYSLFIGIEIIMIFFMIPLIMGNPFVVEKYRWPCLIYWTVFFLFEIAVDLYLRQRVREMDIYNSTVREISSRAAQNWKIHKLGIIIGLPLAFGAVIMYGLLIDGDKFVILGMIVGGVVGFIIGMGQLFKFRQYYRFLQSED